METSKERGMWLESGDIEQPLNFHPERGRGQKEDNEKSTFLALSIRRRRFNHLMVYPFTLKMYLGVLDIGVSPRLRQSIP